MSPEEMIDIFQMLTDNGGHGVRHVFARLECVHTLNAALKAAREEGATIAHNDEAATVHYRVILAIQSRRIAGESHESLAADYGLPLLFVTSLCDAIDQTLFPGDYFRKCAKCGGVECNTVWLGPNCRECEARAEGRREGIEEAAKVCDEYEGRYFSDGQAVGAERCAIGIRALAAKEEPRG